MLIRRGTLVLVLALSALGVPSGVARADRVASSGGAGAGSPGVAGAVDPALLARLARHAEQVEQMKRRGSFTMTGRMEELDRSGNVDGTKEMTVRVTATPAQRLTEIVKYLEDGADKTVEAQKDAEKRRAEREREAKKSKGKKVRDIHLPFLASEQPRYTFSIAERDPAKGQTRVVFQPNAAAEDAFKGSAWVDDATGEVMTVAFSPSKYPTFVDHVDVTIRFDLTTPLGRAPSSFTFDARGGFLVLRKHYRGTATITDARISF